MSSAETHYAHLSSQRAVFIHKLHNYKIESVAWSPQTEHLNTREVLLGTNSGVIIEMVLEYDTATDNNKNCQITRIIELPNNP